MKSASSVFLIFLILVSAFAISGYLASEVQHLSADLSQARARILDLEAQITQGSDEFQSLLNQYNQISADLQKAQEANVQDAAAINALQAELGQAQAQLQKTAQDLESAKTKITELENQVFDLRADLAASQAETRQKDQIIQNWMNPPAHDAQQTSEDPLEEALSELLGTKLTGDIPAFTAILMMIFFAICVVVIAILIYAVSSRLPPQRARQPVTPKPIPSPYVWVNKPGSRSKAPTQIHRIHPS